MSKSDRLRKMRIDAGYASASDAARAMGIAIPTYSHHENGTRDFGLEAARRYATFFKGSVLGLALGPGHHMLDDPDDIDKLREKFENVFPAQSSLSMIKPEFPGNATIGEDLPRARQRIPVLGEGVAGNDGRFIMNGQKIADVLAPPSLEGVRNAYAVYIHGDSMSPRYEAGEIVFVNPFRPVRAGQYVVAQIKPENDGEPPFAYVKRFVSKTGNLLRLEQLNPAPGEDRIMTFRGDDVVSLHLIVGSSEG